MEIWSWWCGSFSVSPDIDPPTGPASDGTRDWTREEIIARIVDESDAAGSPRRLGLGCGIAESNLRQRAEREGTWPDVSYGIGQQTAAFAPVGDRTDTPENRALVKLWLFDPENAIPLMVRKLAANYHAPDNPGTTEDERVMCALARYNSGKWSIPCGYSGNIANYERALRRADEILADIP